uniref:NADH-ubiquinone oxidoreductase chain 2 n=1 Tax=Trichosia lengersdorfi TaxID=1884860 RepID=A0A6G7GC81_9DIPT|nr:NADH dehydrogenase subunit 2 [Trichosia lengersdorfi]QIH95790.1 NADH dehydrogenase subunit 2 [Trichosia lengersdorfi]
MFKNLSKTLFIFMLILGSFVSISSNSWFGAWMGMEINLLSFIPLMTSKNNLIYSESSLNYFLVQSFASANFMFMTIIYMMMMNINFFLNLEFNFNLLFICLTLMLKMGAAPFHFWFPNVMEMSNWNNNLILMTWQKLAPMMILSYIMLNSLLIIFTVLSTFIGALGGLNQTSLRKLMAFSSINHLGWMILAMIFNENMWFMYFLMYSFLNFSVIYFFNNFKLFYLNQMYNLFMDSITMKFCLLSSILSLGGLPPFLGFFPKWMIIQSLLIMKMNFINLFIITMSLITLFYYLKISIAAFLLNFMEFNWLFKMHNKYSFYMMIMNMNFFSLMGFFILINLFYMML